MLLTLKKKNSHHNHAEQRSQRTVPIVPAIISFVFFLPFFFGREKERPARCSVGLPDVSYTQLNHSRNHHQRGGSGGSEGRLEIKKSRGGKFIIENFINNKKMKGKPFFFSPPLGFLNENIHLFSKWRPSSIDRCPSLCITKTIRKFNTNETSVALINSLRSHQSRVDRFLSRPFFFLVLSFPSLIF